MSKENLVAFVTTDFHDKVASLIQSYEGNDVNREDNFKAMVDIAHGNRCTSSDDLQAACWPGEKEVLDWRHASGEDVMYHTKHGIVDVTKGYNGYKVSKVTSKSTYSSAKSTVGKALDAGIPLTDLNGEVRGKTEIGKDYKAKQPQKTVEEKIAVTLDTLSKLYSQADQDVRERVDYALKATYNL